MTFEVQRRGCALPVLSRRAGLCVACSQQTCVTLRCGVCAGFVRDGVACYVARDCYQTLAAKAKTGRQHAKDAKNYGADILQMMAHAKKLEGHSITRSDAHGSINPLGVGSIVMSMFRRVSYRARTNVVRVGCTCAIAAMWCASVGVPIAPPFILLVPAALAPVAIASPSLTLVCISMSLPHYPAQGSTVPMQGAFGI